jgi:serine/threonine protein kinase/Tfp pilus assembly protein PilF
VTETAPPITRCQYCREAAVRLLADRVGCCAACGFVLPLPREVSASDNSAARPDLPGVAPGGVLRGKYRLLQRLGEGAHGATYLAQHEFLSHPCAVKLLPPRFGQATEAAIRRLRNEARVGFRVHDPLVVRVLDCDVIHGVWYFVMEYVDGVDLASVLALKPTLPWQQALRLMSDAAGGLAAIHRVGLLHRDIKPGNLLLGTDGRVRVADLGVAGLAQEQHDWSFLDGPKTAGTLAYTAPEVFRPAGRPGPESDLYSLGVTLYHILLGRLPHQGNQVFRQLVDAQCRPAAWPPDAPANVPDWLVEVVLRLLAIEPQDRIRSAEELAARLHPPAHDAVTVAATEASEDLRPRGVGVVPFQNDGTTSDDDWLGYAIVNYLSRALAETPGVYVADQDALAGLLRQQEGESQRNEVERLLEAGRLVGAGTIVAGRFVRDGTQLAVHAQAIRAEDGRVLPLECVTGALMNLSDIERTLLERLTRALGWERTGLARPHEPGLQAREKFVRGKQAFLRGEYEQAIALAEEAGTLQPDFAEAIGFAGVCLARLGRYEEAEKHHRREELLARSRGDARREVEALANLGAMNYFRGDYDAAESQYLRAANVAEPLGLTSEHAQICNNLGFVLFRRGRLVEAQTYFQRAIEAHRAYGGLTSLVGPYNGLGNVLVEQQRYEEARGYYLRALALAREVDDRTSVGTTHMHLGRCAALEGRFADAKHEFTMALNVLEETRFWNGLARAYEYVAEMHLQLGNCEEAARCADKRIELARQHSNVRMEAAAWLQKAQALQRAGRPEEAAACELRGRNTVAAAAATLPT